MKTFALIIAFLLSEAGYTVTAARRLHLNVHFAPMLAVCMQTCLLFIGGILGILKPVSITLYIFGFLLLMVNIIVEKDLHFLRIFLTPGFLFLMIMICLCIIALHGQIMSHYDSFSHWDLVAREMTLTGHFPTSADVLIRYKSYPLGSACFIYYFSIFTGNAEWIRMLAQTFMMLSFLVPVFALLQGRDVSDTARAVRYGSASWIFCTIYALLFSNIVLTYKDRVTFANLLVDVLLALSGGSALLFIFYYCRSRERAMPSSLIWSIPLLVTCLQIKNSGIFFAVIGSLWLITHMKKSNWWKLLIIAVSPYISLGIWRFHLNLTFTNAELSKHSMSGANYISNISSRSPEFIKNIFIRVAKFSVTGLDFYITFAVLALTALMIFLFARPFLQKYLYAALFSVLVYIAYQAGTFLMFIFSMPEDEANELAGITRYRGTILIFILYIIAVFTMAVLSRAGYSEASSAAAEYSRTLCIRGGRRIFCLVLSALILIIISWWGTCGSFKTIFAPQDTKQRTDFQNLLAEYDVDKDSSYIFLYPDGQASYERLFLKYYYRTRKTASGYSCDEESIAKAAEYEYIFNYDVDNAAVSAWLKEHFPDQAASTVIINHR